MDRGETDFWYEGFGAGVSGYSWLRTVAGRFLREWERSELAAGWRAGLRDLAAYRRDLERADDAATGVAVAFAMWDEVPL